MLRLSDQKLVNDSLVLLCPLTNIPAKLVSAFDKEGDIVLELESSTVQVPIDTPLGGVPPTPLGGAAAGGATAGGAWPKNGICYPVEWLRMVQEHAAHLDPQKL